jgi:hypothetical protein
MPLLSRKPGSETVNAVYIKKALVFRKEEVWIVIPGLASLSMKSPSPNHHLSSYSRSLVTDGFKMIRNPPFSPYIAPADFFFFLRE